MLSPSNLFKSKWMLNMLLCAAAGAVLFSCARPLYTIPLTRQEPFHKAHPVNFSFDLRDVPEGSEAVANLRTYTYNNSLYCSFEELLELTRAEARKLGGDFIFIEKHNPPDQNNSCHSFTATLYRTPQQGDPIIKDPPTHILAPKPLPKTEEKITEEAPEETAREHPAADTTAVSETQEALPSESPEESAAAPEVSEDVAVAAQDEAAQAEPAENPEEDKDSAKNRAANPTTVNEPPKKPKQSKAVVWDDARESAYFAEREQRRNNTPDSPPRAADEQGKKSAEPRPGASPDESQKSDKQTDPAEEEREKTSGPPQGGGYFGYSPAPQTERHAVREKEAKEITDQMALGPIGVMSLYGGFARRLSPLPDGLPPGLETFLDETRKGHVFGAELVFKVAPRNYLGIQFDRFSSNHSDIFMVNNGTSFARGTWEETTGISFVGLTYTVTTVPGPTGTHLFMGVAAGAALYRNTGSMPYEIDDIPVFVPFSFSGSAVSLGLNGGVNIAMADNLFLRIGANLFTGVLTEMDGEINGNTTKLEFESGEGEGLIRGSLSAGISLAF